MMQRSEFACIQYILNRISSRSETVTLKLIHKSDGDISMVKQCDGLLSLSKSVSDTLKFFKICNGAEQALSFLLCWLDRS